MKNRPRDKKAGIAILAVLLIISLADVILRATVYSDISFSASNHGDAMITVIFSALLLAFALKGKERIFYILCGVWLSYFMMNQFYALPSMIETLVYCLNNAITFGIIAAVAHIFSIVSIVAIGVLLVEYMNDGTICNKAFNTFCIVTAALQAFLVLLTLCGTFINGDSQVILAALYEFSRLVMVFLFTFFAYDSAKTQLKKANLSK